MEEMAEDWDNCCPLCMEEMDPTDRQLKPCRCGYQICVWCWNYIMEMAEKDNSEGRCPACRAPYNKEKIVASTCSRSVDMNERKQKSGKAKLKSSEARKNLSNVRVIQRKLVYVVGIPATIADEETLERKEYFGQYGKILKISVSKLNGQNSQHPSASPSASVYVTYMKEEDALRCIQAVNGYVLEGRVLKACFGTTKYCNAWLKHTPCNNPECLYLHDEGTREDSFTKEEMLANYGSKNHFHEPTHPAQRRSGVFLPPPLDASPVASTSQPTSVPTSIPKASSASGSLPKSSSLPAAASWASRSNTLARPSSAGKSSGIGSAKPKSTSSSLLTSDHGSGQILHLNSHDSVKPNVTDEGQGFPPRQLTRASSPFSQTEICSTSISSSAIDVEFPKPAVIRTPSDSRKSSNLAVNHLAASNIDMLESTKPVSIKSSTDRRKSSDTAINHLDTSNIDMELSRAVSDRAASDNRKSSDLAANHLDSSSIDMEFPKPVLDKLFSHSRKSSDVDIVNVDTSSSHMEVPRPVSNRESSQSRNLGDVNISNRTSSPSSKSSDLDMNNLQGGSQVELKSKSVSQKIVDALDGNTGADSLAEKDSNIMSLLEKRSISYADLGIADEHSSKDICETEDIKIFPSATSSVSCHLPADTETLNHYSGDNLKHLNNDQISAGGGSTVSTSRTKDSSEDPWSETAHTDQSLVFINDDLEQVSRISSIEEDKSIQLEKDKTCEDAVNGHRENDLITDMFATGFDLWTDGNPQDLAQLLFNGESVELPSQVPAPEPLPSWKSSSTKQSRFHFARQEHVAGEAIPLNTSDFQAGGQDRWLEKQHASLTTNASNILNEISPGESFQNKLGESFATSSSSNSKSVVGAPPGFSTIRASAVPPPGFSQHAWAVDSRRNPESNQGHRSPVVANIYNQLEAASAGINDMEFIDPAIMAVGKGKLEPGMRSSMSYAGCPSLPGYVSPAALTPQQLRVADYDTSYQPSQERSYRSYGSLNSISQLGYSNQDRGSSLSSIFQSSFNDINKQRLPGQYRDSINLQQLMQDSVYGNGTTKVRYQPTEWDDWKRLSEVNSSPHQSVNDAVGRLAMSQMSLDRVLQSRLEELALTKELGSKYYADTAIREDQGQYSNSRVGRYYLQN